YRVSAEIPRYCDAWRIFITSRASDMLAPSGLAAAACCERDIAPARPGGALAGEPDAARLRALPARLTGALVARTGSLISRNSPCPSSCRALLRSGSAGAGQKAPARSSTTRHIQGRSWNEVIVGPATPLDYMVSVDACDTGVVKAS